MNRYTRKAYKKARWKRSAGRRAKRGAVEGIEHFARSIEKLKEAAQEAGKNIADGINYLLNTFRYDDHNA